MLKIPIKAPKMPGGYEMKPSPLLEPHLVMHHLFTTIGVQVPTGRVHKFWRIHRTELKEPWAVNNVASDDHVPYALYGDAAKIQDDGTKMVGIFLSLPAVWRPRSGRCGRFCLWAMEEHKFFGHHTLHAVLTCIVVSCIRMFHGFDPERPALNFAGGRRFVCTEIKGDWQWLKQQFRFRSNWNKPDSVCFLCTAKGRSPCEKDLYYCLDNQHWIDYDLVSFLGDQMGELQNPCTYDQLMSVERSTFGYMIL